MTIFVCVDEQGGILFNRRRISSDREVIADIMKSIGDTALFMRDYSSKLFPADDRICVTDNYLEAAGIGDALFLEDAIPDDLLKRAKKVVVYHWNRLYPSDVKFPLAQFCNWARLESSVEFKGYSHERIIREVYVL